MLTYFLKYDLRCIKIFSSLPPDVTILKNDESKFKAAVRKYLNTHSFYFVDDLQYLCKMYVISHTVNLCIFAVYTHTHTHTVLWLTDSWNVCVYVCMYVCLYVCMCVCV